jgi:hypothetical protein
VVSGALLGGIFLQGFTWLTALFPSSTFLSWWAAVGPGLAGIGIGRQPAGIIPTVGEEQRDKKARKRAERAAKAVPPPDASPPAAAAEEPVGSATPGA